METQEPTEKNRVPFLFPVFTETQEPTEKKRVPFFFPWLLQFPDQTLFYFSGVISLSCELFLGPMS